jgi:hypothetical protein
LRLVEKLSPSVREEGNGKKSGQLEDGPELLELPEDCGRNNMMNRWVVPFSSVT